MKRRLGILMTLLLYVLLFQYSSAQKRSKEQQKRLYKFQFYRICRVMDSNGDKKFSKQEWKGKPDVFDLLDTDNDGFITETEFCNRQPLDDPEVTLPESDEPDQITIRTGTLKMTGKQPESRQIRTGNLVMTGLEPFPNQIRTPSLVMTGKQPESSQIRTASLMMTGLEPFPSQIRTASLVMTGKQPESRQIRTGTLLMTGKSEKKSLRR
jgi:hypothetical protein